MFYLTKFHRCMSNRLDAGRGLKNLGTLGPPVYVDMAVPLEICYSLSCATVPHSVILGQTVRA